MTRLIFLGTGNALPDEHHENTHLALSYDDRLLMIDCVHNAVVRLGHAGVNYQHLTDLVLTHFHPDHVSGVPSLLMHSWLAGRRSLLHIYGLAHTLDRIEKVMEFYDWGSWPNFFPVQFHRLVEQEMHLALETPQFRLFTSPVRHMIPAIGVRIELAQNGKILAYSGDTAPCDEVVRLAQGADVLIHESGGATNGHTSAGQAGEIAGRAGAGHLYLVHYPTGDFDSHSLEDEARQTFSGPVTLAEDFMSIDL
ncbi:MAG: MBL fold metallo-hydrolase [Anaerolineales bacterium]|nr:MBL fold metallo-hydrolase [Anaerolineales bacterium]